MAETEQLIYINGHAWVRVPSNITHPTVTYSESDVRAAGGDPAVVRGPVISTAAVWSDTNTEK